MTEKNIDNYTFLTSDVLGVGSFGTVFQGFDSNSNRYVAMKMIAKDNLLNDPKGLSGLMTEINIMKKLNHKNIVQLIDVLETQNNIYIIQELCENGDLSKFLKKNILVDEKLALNIILDVLQGFYELLKYRIIHRDLKPANILIHNNTYKLADFGFSKFVENFNPNTLQSQVGTPLYMSPQILRNEKYSMKCDIWSLGFLFYEILYGKTPWVASSIPQLVKNINTQPLVFHDSINQVSNGVKDFISKCLAIQEVDRISWQEVFIHPIFAQHFSQAPLVGDLFEEKELSIAMSMRQQSGTQSLSINELLRQLVEDEDRILDIEDFIGIFLAINENLLEEQIHYIFTIIDEEYIGKITCKNLLDWLIKHDICQEETQIRSCSNTIYGVPEKRQGQQVLQQNELSQDRQLIQILYEEIKINNLNLVELFQKFASFSNTMSYQDFTNMMLNYDSTLSDWEIFEAYKLFAPNKSVNINLNQFKQVLEQNFQDDDF